MKRIVRPLSILLTLLLLVSLCACGGDKAAVYVSFDEVGKVVFSPGKGYTLLGWSASAMEVAEGVWCDGPLESIDGVGDIYEFNVVGNPGDQQEFTLYYCPEGKENEEAAEQSISAIVSLAEDGTVAFSWNDLPDGVLAMK